MKIRTNQFDRDLYLLEFNNKYYYLLKFNVKRKYKQTVIFIIRAAHEAYG